MAPRITISSALTLALVLLSANLPTARAQSLASLLPLLDVQGTPSVDDVFQSTLNRICGFPEGVNNTVLDGSTAVKVAQGATSVNIQTIALQDDASLDWSVSLDTTGTGQNITSELTASQEGPDASDAGTTATVTLQLPSDLQCTGGANADRCLLVGENDDFVQTCVVLQQVAGTPARRMHARDFVPSRRR